MIFQQRRFSNKTKYEFKNEELLYTVKGSDGSYFFSINYESIPFDEYRQSEERNSWFKNVGMFWGAIGILQIFLRYFEDGQFRGSLWLTLGILGFAAFYFFRTKYTIIPTSEGNLFIIQNNKHNDIISEINRRRNKQLNKKYGEIDFANDPENELNKFVWLKEHNVIAENQFNEIKNKIFLFNESQANRTSKASELN